MIHQVDRDLGSITQVTTDSPTVASEWGMGHAGQMDVVKARSSDVASWMELVAEVEPLFGPMPAFTEVIQKHIHRGSAFVVRDDHNNVLGAVLRGGQPPQIQIRWLAVRSAARRSGIGRALIAAALRDLPTPCRVDVVKFGADTPAGAAARGLYMAFGFHPKEHLPTGPEGGSRQRFQLDRE